MAYLKTKRRERLTKIIGGSVVLAFAAWALTSSALTTYPPGSLLQPNDVTTSHIRDGTIINADISNAAGINTTKLGSAGCAGCLLFDNTNSLGTSTLLNYATTTGAFGIGTSTPRATLGVQGNALISGTLSTGGLTATGTINFNGVGYTFPAADGTNGQVFKTNGAGVLSFGGAGAHTNLISTSTPIATTSIRINLTSSTHMHVILTVTGRTQVAGQSINIRFNDDASANYGQRSSKNGAADTTVAAGVNFQLNDTSDTGAGVYYVDIWGRNGTNKAIYWNATHNLGGTGAPDRYEGSGQYNNTASTTQLLFLAGTSGTDTFNALTGVIVQTLNE